MEENSSLGPGCLISKNEMPFLEKGAEPEVQGGWGATANVGGSRVPELRGDGGGHHAGRGISNMVPPPAKPRAWHSTFPWGLIRILPFPFPHPTETPKWLPLWRGR